MSYSSAFNSKSPDGYKRAQESAAVVSATPNVQSEISGPSADVGASNTVLGKTASFVTGAFDSGLSGGSKTALSTMTGQNFADHKSLKTNSNTMSSGASAAGNVSACVAAQGIEADAQQGRGVTVSAIEDMQAEMGAALEAVDAGDAFTAPAQRSEAGVATGLAVSMALPVVGTAILANDIKSAMSPNLDKNAKCLLAKQAAQCLTPVRDSDGNVVGPAAVPNNLNHEVLENAEPAELVKLFEQCMKPADQHDEVIAFDAKIAECETVLSFHNQNSDIDDMALSSDSNELDVRDVNQEALAVMKADLPVGFYAIEYIEAPDAARVECSNAGMNSGAIAAILSSENKVPESKLYVAPPQPDNTMGQAMSA